MTPARSARDLARAVPGVTRALAKTGSIEGLAGSIPGTGRARTEFECCDTTFRVEAEGFRADRAVERARERALELEAQLDAFDPDSAVARLNREGRVENPHVAELVRRGLAYRRHTGGAFDIGHGETEHALKAYLRGEREDRPEGFGPRPGDGIEGGDGNDGEWRDRGAIAVEGDLVRAAAPVDLNGLAKGYVVDRAAEALAGAGRSGFVDGGGDIASPTGPVGIEDPDGGRPLRVVGTDWNVATSGSYRRTRGPVDHVYDPRAGELGADARSVTVLARRDVTEADALATTVAALGPSEGLSLVEDWDGAEAFVLSGGRLRWTDGFPDHLVGGERP